MTSAMFSHRNRRGEAYSFRRVRRLSFMVFMSAMAIIWLIPLIWMFSISLSQNEALKASMAGLLPVAFTIENFIFVFQGSMTPQWLFNSFLVTVITTVFTLLFSAMAGYAFARIPFRGKAFIYPLVLAGLMVPREALVIPLFLMVSDLGFLNTYEALILPRIALPLGIFIMTAFMAAIPLETEEAALLDGANHWSAFWRIFLPLSYPALTALGIFTFIGQWNDYLWPLIAMNKKEMFTITTGLASLQGNFAQAEAVGSLMARGVVASLPLLVLFLIFQRQLVRGIELGSGYK